MKLRKITVFSLFSLFTMLVCKGECSVFPNDPIGSQSSGSVTRTFMQLSHESPYNDLSPGISIIAQPGARVYAPVEFNKTATVYYIGEDFVVLAADDRTGEYEICMLGQINPAPYLIRWQSVDREDLIGTLKDDRLHFEYFISSTGTIGPPHLYDPARYALQETGYFNDSDKPDLIQTTLNHETAGEGQLITWQIDVSDNMQGYLNAVGGMELLIDDVSVDKFDFKRFTGKDGVSLPSADEFYHLASPPDYPSGMNDPNVMRMKLSWQRNDSQAHTWKLRWWDGSGNIGAGGQANQFSQGGGQIYGTIDALPLISSFELGQNPSKDEANFKLHLPRQGSMRVTIYDVKGRVVRELIDENRPAGVYPLNWNGKNDKGNNAPSGIYFIGVSLPSGEFREKITLIR